MSEDKCSFRCTKHSEVEITMKKYSFKFGESSYSIWDLNIILKGIHCYSARLQQGCIAGTDGC